MTDVESGTGRVPRLKPGEVHVWRAAVGDDAARCASDVRLLDREERERAASFRFEPDHRRYVVAHVLLRRVLGAYLGREPQLVRLERSRNGKPVLGGASRLSGLGFSVSHDGDLVLIAVSRFARVGVDVQSSSVPGSVDVLADAMLTSAERAQLGEISSGESRPGLARFWARKEAALKATGMGLAGGPERVEVAGDSPVSVRAPGRRFRSPMRVRDLDVDPRYEAALAASPWCRRVVHVTWGRS